MSDKPSPISEWSSAQEAILKAELETLERLRPFPINVFRYDPTPSLSLKHTDLVELAGAIRGPTTQVFYSRKPFLGPIIVFLKRCASAVVRKLIRPQLSHQTTVNEFTWNLAVQVQELEQRVALLERKAD